MMQTLNERIEQLVEARKAVRRAEQAEAELLASVAFEWGPAAVGAVVINEGSSHHGKPGIVTKVVGHNAQWCEVHLRLINQSGSLSTQTAIMHLQWGHICKLADISVDPRLIAAACGGAK